MAETMTAPYIAWFQTRAAFMRAAQELSAARAVIDAHLAGTDGLTGYCAACGAIVSFEIRRSTGWTDLRESIVCPRCQLNGRMRMIVNALRQIDGLRNMRFHAMERLTPLYAYLSGQYPNCTGSEFVGAGLRSGTLHQVGGVETEHQDFLALSFPDSSIDVLLHGDVLEHVPDHNRAFAEAARVIKSGGTMLFTTPFFDLDQHVTRCRIENGQLHHIERPAYHGNPLSAEGSLVFTDFDWPLLNDLQRAGFSAEIGLVYDPFQGIVSNNNPHPSGFMWPILFRATRI